jgi:hypothetical protein
MSEFEDFNNDPIADFFARERAVLGQDADIFTSIDNSSYSTPVFNMSPPQNAFEFNFPKTKHLESSQVRFLRIIV